MTRDQILSMAKQAGFDWPGVVEIPIEGRLAKFAALVVAAEREECAKACDERAASIFPNTKDGMGFSFSQRWDAAREAERLCAAAIRARKP